MAHRFTIGVEEEFQIVDPTTCELRSHVSELLAKCLRQGALDQDLSAEDKDRMLKFLTQYGDLAPDGRFLGTNRSGYKVSPGAGPRDGVPRDPLPMHALLDADLWNGLLFEDIIDWQATMFQPVGGMDMMTQSIELGNRPHVVIATPGRLVDHLLSSSGEWDLTRVKFLVGHALLLSILCLDQPDSLGARRS